MDAEARAAMVSARGECQGAAAAALQDLRPCRRGPDRDPLRRLLRDGIAAHRKPGLAASRRPTPQVAPGGPAPSCSLFGEEGDLAAEANSPRLSEDVRAGGNVPQRQAVGLEEHYAVGRAATLRLPGQTRPQFDDRVLVER